MPERRWESSKHSVTASSAWVVYLACLVSREQQGEKNTMDKFRPRFSWKVRWRRMRSFPTTNQKHRKLEVKQEPKVLRQPVARHLNSWDPLSWSTLQIGQPFKHQTPKSEGGRLDRRPASKKYGCFEAWTIRKQRATTKWQAWLHSLACFDQPICYMTWLINCPSHENPQSSTLKTRDLNSHSIHKL